MCTDEHDATSAKAAPVRPARRIARIVSRLCSRRSDHAPRTRDITLAAGSTRGSFLRRSDLRTSRPLGRTHDAGSRKPLQRSRLPSAPSPTRTLTWANSVGRCWRALTSYRLSAAFPRTPRRYGSVCVSGRSPSSSTSWTRASVTMQVDESAASRSWCGDRARRVSKQFERTPCPERSATAARSAA
jgi:hypothetical protein